jgi:hypothetical protein
VRLGPSPRDRPPDATSDLSRARCAAAAGSFTLAKHRYARAEEQCKVAEHLRLLAGKESKVAAEQREEAKLLSLLTAR